MKTQHGNLATIVIAGTIAGLALAAGLSQAEEPAKPVKDVVKGQVTDGPRPGERKKETARWGKFVAFKDRTLTLKGNIGALVWSDFPRDTAVVRWDDAGHQYVPAGTLQTLSKVEPGAWVFVSEDKKLVRIGAGKESHVSGKFISFKDNRLRMVGKDLGNYAQEGGTEIHFKPLPDGVPVYKRTPGKNPTFIGPAETILPAIKEDSSITVYGEGDDNFTRIEIDEPKK